MDLTAAPALGRRGRRVERQLAGARRGLRLVRAFGRGHLHARRLRSGSAAPTRSGTACSRRGSSERRRPALCSLSSIVAFPSTTGTAVYQAHPPRSDGFPYADTEGHERAVVLQADAGSSWPAPSCGRATCSPARVLDLVAVEGREAGRCLPAMGGGVPEPGRTWRVSRRSRCSWSPTREEVRQTFHVDRGWVDDRRFFTDARAPLVGSCAWSRPVARALAAAAAAAGETESIRQRWPTCPAGVVLDPEGRGQCSAISSAVDLGRGTAGGRSRRAGVRGGRRAAQAADAACWRGAEHQAVELIARSIVRPAARR